MLGKAGSWRAIEREGGANPAITSSNRDGEALKCPCQICVTLIQISHLFGKGGSG